MIIYDIQKRIELAEHRGIYSPNLAERLYFLDVADMLRVRKHEKEIIEALQEVEKYPCTVSLSE